MALSLPIAVLSNWCAGNFPILYCTYFSWFFQRRHFY